MRKILKKILTVLFTVLWVALTLSPFTHKLPGAQIKFHKVIGTRCGKIIAVQSPDAIRNSKHSSTVYVSNEIAVDFEDGKREDMEVSFKTFASHDIGDRICFDKNLSYVRPEFYHAVWDFFTMGVGVVNIIIAILVFIFSIGWVFTGKSWKEFWDI